jgi:hypothetical protein
LATKSAARVPDAPARFSTTRGTGKIGCAALATVRATTSVPPPAE